MPSLKSIKDLQRLLGMINYLSSYIPKLTDETSLLCSLLKKIHLGSQPKGRIEMTN